MAAASRGHSSARRSLLEPIWSPRERSAVPAIVPEPKLVRRFAKATSDVS